MKKVLICVLGIAILAILLFTLSGCSSKDESSANTNKTNGTKTTMKNTTKSNTTSTENTNSNKVDYEALAEKQMAMPEDGETIAIIHVKDFGDITVKFFDDVAPKAVENFVEHSKAGYYDGVKFHRVMNEFMIQSGDPLGNGTGGESIWGKGFEEELDGTLVPYRGSLCMASAGTGTSTLGSQFFITQANYDEEMEKYMKSGGFPEGLLNCYKKYGGYLSLYNYYTVFGQVIDGIDVVDAIAAVEVKASSNGEKSTPVEDVIIDTIEVTTYNK